MRVVAVLGLVVAVVACGRLSFDPVAGQCDGSHATQATAAVADADAFGRRWKEDRAGQEARHEAGVSSGSGPA